MPDAAAVVERHPGRAVHRVHQRIQDRPVGDRVGAVLHRLGLAVRATRPSRSRGDRGRSRSAPSPCRVAHQLVEEQPRLRALAVAEPADARRQALERTRSLRQRQPARSIASSPGTARAARGRCARMSSGIAARAPPSGTAPVPSQKSGRMYAGTKPGIRERVVARRLPAPARGCCCRSRTRARPSSSARASPRRARPSTAIALASRTPAGSRVAQLGRRVQREARRDVAVQRIVRATSGRSRDRA